jgi:hypothetical protein
VNIECDTGERIAQPLFDQRYCEVRNVDPGPPTAQFLRRVYRRAAATKRIKDYIALGEFKQTTQKSRRNLSNLLFGNGFCQFMTSQF